MASSSGRIVSIIFRFVFFIIITLNLINYISIWFPKLILNSLNIFIILIFLLFFSMTIWTIYITTISDPGQVPLYWGFYIGDPESMRCRYCLMCNVFKPVRCHHCSMCNRCVLNMDHHCPWINNCIGFYNRKFFMQMVFYLNCTLIFILITNLKNSFDIVKYCYYNKMVFNMKFIGKILHVLLYLIDCGMEIILIQFFRFHINLILENKTTIETLDHKGQYFKSKYDQGKWENWIEVMGVNKYLWFVPLKLYYGKPKGNGIDWVELPEENLNSNILAETGKENNENNNNNNVDNNINNNNNNNNINVRLGKEDASSDITGDNSRNLINK